jgi:hypothetical protein
MWIIQTCKYACISGRRVTFPTHPLHCSKRVIIRATWHEGKCTFSPVSGLPGGVFLKISKQTTKHIWYISTTIASDHSRIKDTIWRLFFFFYTAESFSWKFIFEIRFTFSMHVLNLAANSQELRTVYSNIRILLCLQLGSQYRILMEIKYPGHQAHLLEVLNVSCLLSTSGHLHEHQGTFLMYLGSQ